MTGFAVVTTTVATPEHRTQKLQTFACDLMLFPFEKRAMAMARSLVTARLAACVQILPMKSVYAWNGGIEDNAETMLLCKIRLDDYLKVEAAILASTPTIRRKS